MTLGQEMRWTYVTALKQHKGDNYL